MASHPRIFGILCLLCLHILDISSSSPEVVVIGILTEVTSPNECTQIIPDTVYIIEALQWTVDNLNRDKYLGNITLEIEVVDICKPKSPIPKTMQLIKKYKNGSKQLIGILSMTTSQKMLDVSSLLGSLPTGSSLIQIGTTETADKLSDRSKYPTFFRVIPDDDVQMELIVKLLKKLGWNYIAIIYENDVYGTEGATLLSEKLPSQGITLAVKLVLTNGTIFDLSTLPPYKGIQGVVIIAQTWTLKSLNVKDEYYKNFRFILTEAAEIDSSFPSFKSFEKAFSIRFTEKRLLKIERHWETLFNVKHTKENPFFRQLIEQSLDCPDVLNEMWDLNGAANKLSSRIHKNSLLPKVTGLYTLAFLVKNKQEQCGKSPCSSLILELEDIQNHAIDFSPLINISDVFLNVSGEFNKFGNLVFRDGSWAYDVYYNRKIGPDKFEFQEVGKYDGNKLMLNTSYTADELSWGVCRIGINCRSTEFPKFIYRKGDIWLFGIVPFHSGNSSIIPGEQLAEAMLYAVEQLNQEKKYFPNKEVGIIIMDSNNDQISTFKSLWSFWHGTADICESELDCRSITKKTLVYIGALSSEVSIRISQLMEGKNTIQISYGSTSSVFRDPLSYANPNFFRIPPSDNLQIAAMIDICVKMKWLYISMIYANNEYGRSAERELSSKAKQQKICVAKTLSIKKDHSPETILEELSLRPKAKVVIVFINSPDLQTFMVKIIKRMTKSDFTFLGSEAWGQSLKVDNLGDKIVGSLSLGIDILPVRGFENYLKTTHVGKVKNNSWREAAMESQCYMPYSLNKVSKIRCRPNITLSDLGSQNQWSPLVIQSVLAAAVGLNRSIKECPNGEVCPNLFKEETNVISFFKGVTLGEGVKEKNVFDKKGDGTLSYAIYIIQKKNREKVYIKIGNWSQSTGLFLETKLIAVPPLQCPYKKRCSECLIDEDSSPPLEKYISAIIAFVLLLLLLAAAILIFWKFSGSGRPQQESTEYQMRCCEDSESTLYMTMDDLTSNENPDLEETHPKTTISEYGSMTIPKRLSSDPASINPGFEGSRPPSNTENETTDDSLQHREDCQPNDYVSVVPPIRNEDSDLEETDLKTAVPIYETITIPKRLSSDPGCTNLAFEGITDSSIS